MQIVANPPLKHLAGSEGSRVRAESGDLTSHAPLIINGDAEFTSKNGVVGGSELLKTHTSLKTEILTITATGGGTTSHSPGTHT